MQDYLILKLDGVLQAWGRESFEGLRPSELFPGRSALLGLIGACLGIDRLDQSSQQALVLSIGFAVRVDQQGQKMTDYHTVKDARVDYHGLKTHDTIQTWREYWQDAKYTLAIWNTENATILLSQVKAAIQKPIYTPVLGRRSCALSRPLFECEVIAANHLEALALVEPFGGTVYADVSSTNSIPLKKRDVPIIHQPRQFASRMVYMSKAKGDSRVLE
ncbi:type I-E CRISPR-associated protein Cas5/CasD [Cellvibrio fontiphilus]|uniref:Type I-E CRISPR-associated protein Cas5/CasD n=1 Tax=Cellvibrio fontiphilus TaxID=1815559 RepID=A0ABV7FK58_9GAMM